MNASTPLRLPAPSPLRMPIQPLHAARTRQDIEQDARLARIIAFALPVLVTILATWEMTRLSTGGPAWIGWVVAILFVPTFAWVAFAAGSALAGLAAPRRDPVTRRAITEGFGGTDFGPTALLVPIYFEDAEAVAGRIERIAQSLAGRGAASSFEVFVLSDTTDAAIAAAEGATMAALGHRLSGILPVHYRRRLDNTGRKAGNIADFVRLWGGRYDTFLVLDADSVMTGATLGCLRARMAAEPDLGLLQTVPRVIGGNTAYAWTQRFASSLYGPVFARGVAAWSGSAGNYWGHNAMIRTRAFAASCGLPRLAGGPPFGGDILSHDFVEAALMRRAGWRVVVDPEIGGSFEEGPETILAAVIRDRRWAEGNLQHLGVIAARGLHPVSRVHLGLGIGAYTVPPLWVGALVIGVALTFVTSRVPPDYFHGPHQLAPDWPVYDSAGLVRLFTITFALLFLPKLIAVVRGLAVPSVRRAHGGPWRLLGGVGAEIVLAALMAPIVIIFHTINLVSIIAGRSVEWRTRRGERAEDSIAGLRPYLWPTFCGTLLTGAALAISPGLALWLAPFSAGLILAIPVGYAVSRPFTQYRRRQPGNKPSHPREPAFDPAPIV